jgi:hypothetical protein
VNPLVDQVSALLTRAGVAHALIGAAALAAAGVARSTFDIDLLTIDTRVTEPGLWAELERHGAEIEIRRGDADDPLAAVVRISRSDDRPIDVIVGRHDWQRRAVERALHDGSGLRIVRPADLVLLKLFAGGTQDLWDIDQLLAATGDELIAAVEADLPDLPRDAVAAWEKIRAQR